MNVSEGRDELVLARLVAAAGDALLDMHSDEHHNRSVLTLGCGDIVSAALRVALVGIEEIDVVTHVGVHPRIGAVDVVPFVPLPSSDATLADATRARDEFAHQLSAMGVPCFIYGDTKDLMPLPEIRKFAFDTVAPHFGPSIAHITAGSCAVSARNPLVAYNLWVDTDIVEARRIAKTIRRNGLRTLGLRVGKHVQVSCNLTKPDVVTPEMVYDLVAARTAIVRAELIGLVPVEVFTATPPHRRKQLDITEQQTIEARLIED